MGKAKLSWVLFVLVLGLVGCPKAEDKKKVVKTVEQWVADLKDKDPAVRRHAASALGGIGPEAEKAVPALIEALKDKDWSVRSRAAWALGSIGPRAEKAVPVLIQALKDKDPAVRSAAQIALKKIQKK